MIAELLITLWFAQTPTFGHCQVTGYVTSAQGTYAHDLDSTCPKDVTITRVDGHVWIVFNRTTLYYFDIPLDCGVNSSFWYTLGNARAYLNGRGSIVVWIGFVRAV